MRRGTPRGFSKAKVNFHKALPLGGRSGGPCPQGSTGAGGGGTAAFRRALPAVPVFQTPGTARPLPPLRISCIYIFHRPVYCSYCQNRVRAAPIANPRVFEKAGVHPGRRFFHAPSAGRAGRRPKHHPGKAPPGQSSFPYCPSSTASSHSLEQSSPGASKATWENQLSLAAPCQCFTPAGMTTTSPGFRARASLPHS